MKKIISILGSTGSIGSNTFNIINKKKNYFSINILAADKNFRLICKQIKLYNPNVYVIHNFKIYSKVKEKYKNHKVKIFNNFNFKKKYFKKSDISIAAIPGIAGLNPTIELTKNSKKILIANKESVICGWNLIKKSASDHDTKIIPIDSEHFSIMKLLEKQKILNVKKIYLTASGGPFLNYKLSKLKYVKPNEAIKHPKWKMGKKISIDSATLMNKMLELIEAEKMFSLEKNIIEIVIHPESLVHAIVEFKNGLSKFIYHETSMLVPLANAIFEDKLDISDFIKPKLSSKNLFFKNLNFINVDKKRYPIINLKSRLNEHISTPIIINATNEILVDQFLKKKIAFTTFYSYLLKVLNDKNYRKYAIKIPKNINQILQIDQWARKVVYEKIKKTK